MTDHLTTVLTALGALLLCCLIATAWWATLVGCARAGALLARLDQHPALVLVAVTGALLELLVLAACLIHTPTGVLLGAVIVALLGIVAGDFTSEHRADTTRRHHLTRLDLVGGAR